MPWRLGRFKDGRSPDSRPSAGARGYDSRWRTIRAAFLKDHPLCVRCGRTATDAHHLVMRREGGPDHSSNLMALCHAHHTQVSNRERTERSTRR